MIYPTGDTSFTFKQFDDDGQVDAWWGTTYTFILTSAGAVAITFDASVDIQGDHTVQIGNDSPNTYTTLTTLKMIYNGYGWTVVSKTVFIDYNA